MKLIVNLPILCDTKDYIVLHKDFMTDLVPMVGMQLQDPAWENPRPIKNVTINPKEDSYLLHVGDDNLPDKDQCEQLKQSYRRHGWLEPGEKQGLEEIWPAIGKRRGREGQLGKPGKKRLR